MKGMCDMELKKIDKKVEDIKNNNLKCSAIALAIICRKCYNVAKCAY